MRPARSFRRLPAGTGKHNPEAAPPAAGMFPWAEDLLQEVFLRLWTLPAQWTGRGSVAAWLGRIAVNLALNHLRSQRRRPHRSLRGPRTDADEGLDPDWLADESSLDPVELLERAEEMEAFRRSVESLPEAKRAVVKMIHEDEMDIPAVAEKLGIPEGTVKSRLYYSIRRLARELGGADGSQGR